ncbi:hypothetical protein Bca52824_046692 [Brassica carinata]|uniref:Uncharacterized protein n=1 Tax=Brassica carinata TaxID=52824 RepID=A0A8X7RHN0_BRACI|nr:hypothetical protein Bca52824_046692 [Brassica carinata]
MTQQMSLLLNGDFTPPLLRRLEGEDQSAKKLDGQHSGRWYQRHAEQRRTKKVLASKTKIYIVLELVSGARELEKQLKQITKEKKEAVRAQDFGKDGYHYDQKIELRDETAAILAKGKEVSKAELLKLAMNELGPIVSESDIQHIVSYASYIYILCSSISFMVLDPTSKIHTGLCLTENRFANYAFSKHTLKNAGYTYIMNDDHRNGKNSVEKTSRRMATVTNQWRQGWI